MAQVLLVNPSPRKGTSARKATTRAVKRTSRSKPIMAKAKRSPAQKAATKKMIAANRARARGAQRAAPRRPAAKRRPARAAPAAAAPKRRRTSARRGRGGWPITSAKAASSAGRALRHRRPNPLGMGGFVKQTLMPSVVGGAGALALDVLVGVLPLPPAMKTGPMAPLVKAAGAVGIGMIAGQFMGRRVGEQVAAGGLTVTVYNVARALIVKASGGKIPGLSEYVSMYPDGSMGEYVDFQPPQLGYESSGGQVGEADLMGYETGVYR